MAHQAVKLLPSSSSFLPCVVRCHGRFLSQLRSSLGNQRRRSTTGPDPGDWVFSPEWWGTQGRGWGRNEGVTVFQRASQMGNGLVSVTAHPASHSGCEDFPELSRILQEQHVTAASEWRVLRFNNETRQSVAKVLLVQEEDGKEASLLQMPNCLAFEYLKSMVSVGLSCVSCAGLDLELVARGLHEMRCLCIGLGGGSLPLFVAHTLKGSVVEVVEIDNTVISAATEFMGFPEYAFPTLWPSVNGACFSNNRVMKDSHASVQGKCSYDMARSLFGGLQGRIMGFEADGAAYVRALVEKGGSNYDLVFIDAFNGKDEVPACFWDGDGPFLTSLSNLLDPIHGTVVVNLHTDMPPPSLLERVTGEFGPGFDPKLPGGKQLQDISRAFRNDLLQQQNDKACAGVAFTVAVPRQQNICLAICRGIDGVKASIVDNLKSAACNLERALEVPFPMFKRISRGFQLVQ